MKIHFLERDGRKNHSDFKMTMGSFSVICSILEKGLRELDAYSDNIEGADCVGIADSLATDFNVHGKKSFGIYFVDCINTIPDVTLSRLRNNPNLKLFSINQHTASLFSKYGFNCEVLGPGIDSDFWIPDGIKSDKFTFIHTGFSNIRSGLDQLLPAFRLAFGGNKDVRLIIKNTSSSELLEQRINEYRNNLDIFYLNKRLNFAMIRELYDSSHALCSVFRHSGHGLPIGEAACMNCVPVVGDFEPSNEIANGMFACLLKPKKTVEINKIKSELINYWGLTDTFGELTFPEEPLVYDYDIEEYADMLRKLYLKYAVADVARNCRDEALKIWDYKKSAKKLLEKLSF